MSRWLSIKWKILCVTSVFRNFIHQIGSRGMILLSFFFILLQIFIARKRLYLEFRNSRISLYFSFVRFPRSAFIFFFVENIWILLFDSILRSTAIFVQVFYVAIVINRRPMIISLYICIYWNQNCIRFLIYFIII